MRVICCWSKNKTSSTASGDLTIISNCFTTCIGPLEKGQWRVTQGRLPSELLYSEVFISGQQEPDCSCFLVNLSFPGPAHYWVCYVGLGKFCSVHWVEKCPRVSFIISLKGTLKNLRVKMNWGYGIKMESCVGTWSGPRVGSFCSNVTPFRHVHTELGLEAACSNYSIFKLHFPTKHLSSREISLLCAAIMW